RLRTRGSLCEPPGTLRSGCYHEYRCRLQAEFDDPSLERHLPRAHVGKLPESQNGPTSPLLDASTRALGGSTPSRPECRAVHRGRERGQSLDQARRPSSYQETVESERSNRSAPRLDV